MKIITYQSKDGRLVGTAKLYELEIGTQITRDYPRNYRGEPYERHIVSQEDKEWAEKDEAKLYKLFNRKCYQINYSIA